MVNFADDYTGDTLKSKRERLYLTQAELAEKIGVTPTAISAWEQGRNRPKLRHIKKLDELFNVVRQ